MGKGESLTGGIGGSDRTSACCHEYTAKADLIEGYDGVEVTISVSQVVGRLCEQRQLRLWPHPGKQSCLQQPVAVCLYVLRGTHIVHHSIVKGYQTALIIPPFYRFINEPVPADKCQASCICRSKTSDRWAAG